MISSDRSNSLQVDSSVCTLYTVLLKTYGVHVMAGCKTMMLTNWCSSGQGPSQLGSLHPHGHFLPVLLLPLQSCC